jgi:hypothetical protein
MSISSPGDENRALAVVLAAAGIGCGLEAGFVDPFIR